MGTEASYTDVLPSNSYSLKQLRSWGRVHLEKWTRSWSGKYTPHIDFLKAWRTEKLDTLVLPTNLIMVALWKSSSIVYYMILDWRINYNLAFLDPVQGTSPSEISSRKLGWRLLLWMPDIRGWGNSLRRVLAMRELI